MESQALFEIENIKVMTPHSLNGHATRRPRNRIAALQKLVFQLLLEIQAINEVQTVSLAGGIDFYDQVSRFEIDLIRGALQMTQGHQTRAARLLNLNPTTLNSKIKHYNIPLDGFSRAYVPIESSEIETRAQT